MAITKSIIFKILSNTFKIILPQAHYIYLILVISFSGYSGYTENNNVKKDNNYKSIAIRISEGLHSRAEAIRANVSIEIFISPLSILPK